jgi:hypothetical protein
LTGDPSAGLGCAFNNSLVFDVWHSRSFANATTFADSRLQNDGRVYGSDLWGVWGFIVAGHHALLAPLFIHLGLLLTGTALLIRLLLLLLARLLLTTAALLLIALIGHQVAPWFDKRKTLAQVRRSFATLWQTVASRPYQWATGN